MPKKGSNMPTMGIRSAKPAKPSPPRTSLADALFSGTRQRVLGLLFGQPKRSFFATELIALAGAGSGGVQRELQRLSDAGLVTVSRVGNQKHYQANPKAPVFAEVCGIATKTFGLAGPLGAALKPLQKRIELALVYGSVASGRDSAKSDIDILIVADDLTLENVYAALAKTEKQLARPVNPTLYTRAEFQRRRKANNPFLAKLLTGKTLPLIGALTDG